MIMTYAQPPSPARAPPTPLTPAPLTSQFGLERPIDINPIRHILASSLRPGSSCYVHERMQPCACRPLHPAALGRPGPLRKSRRGHTTRQRDYLPLTADVLAGHLKGNAHVGVYPLLDGDRCWWLTADFDGPDALTEALMYVKAGRAFGVPVALEVSRSGIGMHAWTFFTAPVPAETARRLGTGLLREAMAIRGKVSLASYDRLFPSQDLLPSGGWGT